MFVRMYSIIIIIVESQKGNTLKCAFPILPSNTNSFSIFFFLYIYIYICDK